MSFTLNKIGLLVIGLLFGVVIGAACTFGFLHHPNHNWIQLTKDGKGLAYSLHGIFDTDISMPNLASPTGQAKFVDRDLGKGTELGFVVKTTMDKLDTTRLPARYKQTQKFGEGTIGPTDTVTYSSHLEFTLKDPDGFVLMTTSSDPMDIWSGQENVLQGFAKDAIPASLLTRTRAIQMQLVVDKCQTCQP
jgi:hypothetical protein